MEWCEEEKFTTRSPLPLSSNDQNWARADPCRCNLIDCSHICLDIQTPAPTIDPRRIRSTPTIAPTPLPPATVSMQEFPYNYINFFTPCDKTRGAITSIKLENRRLTGELHDIWKRATQNLTFIEKIMLKNNKIIGSIPREWGKLEHLREIDLSFNTLTGPLPHELFGIHGQMGPKHLNGLNLTILNLAHNRLDGSIPRTLTNMTTLQNLNLASNFFTGVLPPYLNRLELLTSLQLQGNRLKGMLPPSITEMTALRDLNLGANHFSGTVPEGFGTESECLLKTVDLHGNKFTGKVPYTLADACPKIEELNLYDNKLFGKLPKSFYKLTELRVLRVHKNRLRDRLPHGVFHMNKLVEVDISNNEFEGNVGWFADAVMSNCTDSLELLFMQNNRLSGTFPEKIMAMPWLRALSVAKNKLSGEVVDTLDFSKLTLCDLRENTLAAWKCVGGMPGKAQQTAESNCGIPATMCS